MRYLSPINTDGGEKKEEKKPEAKTEEKKEEKKEEVLHFTQEALDERLKRAEGKGLKAALAELGVEDIGKAKELFAAAKKAQEDALAKAESDKSELQKTAEAKTAAEKKAEELDGKLKKTSLENSVIKESLKAGVSPDRIDMARALYKDYCENTENPEPIADFLAKSKETSPFLFSGSNGGKTSPHEPDGRAANLDMKTKLSKDLSDKDWADRKAKYGL